MQLFADSTKVRHALVGGAAIERVRWQPADDEFSVNLGLFGSSNSISQPHHYNIVYSLTTPAAVLYNYRGRYIYAAMSGNSHGDSQGSANTFSPCCASHLRPSIGQL